MPKATPEWTPKHCARRENRARQRGQRGKIKPSQRRGEAGILHSDFQCQRPADTLVKPEQSPAPVAAQKPDPVMQNHGQQHDRTSLLQGRPDTRDNSPDDKQDRHHRHQRKRRFDPPHCAMPECIDHNARQNG